MGKCFSCFKDTDSTTVCPFCGAKLETEPVEPIHLTPGTILADRYVIGLAVGSGGFGIIYQAWDMKLDTVIAVKEFFASRLVTRAAGTKEVIANKKSLVEFQYRKARFLSEARNMAKFGSHKNIPNVFEFFEENNTAYIVMELLRGVALNEYLQGNEGIIDQDFALLIANEVGNALISLHDKGIIHRDVAPDNIYISSGKEIRIKLLDLGAAKLTDSTEDVIDIILKPGYSPVEQYDNTMSIGAWTDVYALGATLYLMLTGVKPEESTNRKIKDEVLPPREINPEISENLSNAIMKAIAVDKHMRFKTVSDFLKAINGEKSVLPLAKERKRRKGKRLVGIFAACVTLFLVASVVINTYIQKKADQTLSPADISIWFSVSEGSSEEAAMKKIASDFQGVFPDISIELKAIPEDEYLEVISRAANEGTLPTLFESTGLPTSLLGNCIELTSVLNSTQAKNCFFLDQYDSYYSSKEKLPLAIEVPVAYVITSGASSVEYSDKYFSSVTDFGDGTLLSIYSGTDSLIMRNFPVEGTVDESHFLNNDENTSAVMLGTTMQINLVRETLTNYEKTYVYPDTEKVYCRFTYEWSISNTSKNERIAAERFLCWMLGNSYQNTLMISTSNEGQIPVNKDSFDNKTSQKYLSALQELKDKLVFEDEDAVRITVLNNNADNDTGSTSESSELGEDAVAAFIGDWICGEENISLQADETFIWSNCSMFDDIVVTRDGFWSYDDNIMTFAMNSGGLYYCTFEKSGNVLSLTACSYDGTLMGDTMTFEKK